MIWVVAGFTSSTTLLSAPLDAQSTIAIFLDLDFALSLRIALSVVFGAGLRVYLVTLRPLALVARLLWYSVSRDSSRCVGRAMAYSASR